MPKFQFDATETVGLIQRQSSANRANPAKTPAAQAISAMLTNANSANNSAGDQELANFSRVLADCNSKSDKALSGLAVLARGLADAITLDDLWTVIGKVRQADLPLAEKNEFWQACKPILAKFYEAMPSQWHVDGKPANFTEWVAVEWQRRKISRAYP